MSDSATYAPLRDAENTMLEDEDARKLQAMAVQRVYRDDDDRVVVSLAFAVITTSLAELSSSIPSSGGDESIVAIAMCRLTRVTVYHWATLVTGPKYGRVTSFYKGLFNFLAWVFAISSTCAILGNALVQMYLVQHPEVEWQPWMVFVAF
ncbi:hypothetical protein VTN77DRAFT_591 [Rasamsonia byssochlamydoides]|uniref:uncharacterized protein n=1 Tax=Rasamsonia byssochlamydoides TaxID=89139 RepID=UPI003743C010